MGELDQRHVTKNNSKKSGIDFKSAAPHPEKKIQCRDTFPVFKMSIKVAPGQKVVKRGCAHSGEAL